MIDPIYSMALTAGLLGSGHCIGMCGGIVAALALSRSKQAGNRSFQLCYNLGRIGTYTILGFIVGWMGSAIAYADSFRFVARGILLGSDGLIILLGLGSAFAIGRFNLMRLECSGPFAAIAGTVKRLNMKNSWWSAIPLGSLMGLLPCGYLYSMAIAAAQTASASKGALTLLSFGLGTLPSLLLFGESTSRMNALTRHKLTRFAALAVAAMGAFNLHRHLQMMGLLS